MYKDVKGEKMPTGIANIYYILFAETLLDVNVY